LASRVLDHLQAGGYAVGAHLTEAALAEAFGVSRSPIRSALALLAEKKVLRFEPNRGYFLGKPPTHLRATELEVAPSDDEALFRRVASDRFNARLPERFTETLLLRRYHRSRAQIGKLLERLVREGLAQRNDGRGWVFSSVLNSQRAHEESYRFRLLIEPQALLLDTFRADAVQLQRSREAHLELLGGNGVLSDRARLFRIDSEFHEMLAAFSRNTFVLNAIRQQNRLRRLAEYEGYSNRRRLRAWCSEHLAIIERLLQGDRAAASTLMHRHLKKASRNSPRYGK
jgi:DNA-binding GntR family transcriptional regulator